MEYVDDDFYEQDAIEYFRSLIQFKENKQKKKTTIAHLTGHIGRHMPGKTREWFCKQYSNHEYINFFIKHDNIFEYNRHTGCIHVKGMMTRKFEKPRLLVEMETTTGRLLTKRESGGFNKAVDTLQEYELFHLIFVTINNSYKQKCAIPTCDLQLLLASFDFVAKFFYKFTQNIDGTFSNKLDAFFSRMPEVFFFNKALDCLQFQNNILGCLLEVLKILDESSYELLKIVIAKALEKHAYELEELEDKIKKRFQHVFGYMFEGEFENYKFIDFIYSYPEQFVVKVDGGKKIVSLK